MFKVGDEIWLEAEKTSIFYPGVMCRILIVNADGSEILKMEAIESNPALAKHGFFIEDGKYVAFNAMFSLN